MTDRMVEKVGRALAARKMVMEDGGKLPKDLWQQCVPAARAALDACCFEEMREALVTITNVGSGEAQRIALETLRAIDND